MKKLIATMALFASLEMVGPALAQTCSSPIGVYGLPVTGTEQTTLGPVLQYDPLNGGGVGRLSGDGFVTTECTWFQQGFEASDGKVSGRVWLYTGAIPGSSGSFVIPLDPIAFPAGGGGNGVNFPHAECHATLGKTGDDYAANYPNPFWLWGSTVQEARYNNTPTTYTDDDGAVFPPNSVEFLWETLYNLPANSTLAINIFCVSKASQ